MRQITVKYEGSCKKCSATLPVNTNAMYERHVGIFCVGCEPTDIEEIRAYKQESADKKADKYEEWAAKRRDRAAAVFEHNKPYTSDYAFNTQPGHIPIRARIINQENKAHESLQVAERMQEKAESLRHVRVRGDAERERQEKRDAIKPLLKKGMRVWSGLYDYGKIKKINKKTATVDCERGFTVNVDLSWLKIIRGG